MNYTIASTVKGRLECFIRRIYQRIVYWVRDRKYAANAVPGVVPLDWSQEEYNRVAIVNLVVSRYPTPVRYLEIGCDNDWLFHAVFADEKVGVDPVRGGNRRMTSDAFFAQNQDEFDVVFVDGLHTFEQCRVDAKNALAVVPVGGMVLFHDFLPRDWREAHVPRLQSRWLGDVWKVAFELVSSSGIEFRLLSMDYGIGVAKKIAPRVEYADRYNELAPAKFDYLTRHLNQLPVESFESARAWLRGHDG